MIQLFIYTFVIIIFVGLVRIYYKLVYIQKRFYDEFRAQGVPGEPFVPIFGQIRELQKYRNTDNPFDYHEELARRHGYLYLFCFGPLMRLICLEPDLLADVLGRHNISNYAKSEQNLGLKTILGSHSLLVAEGEEHERARRMINPAFHHGNLKSMISIITDRTAKAIDSILTDEYTSKPVDIQILFNTLTLSIIASSAFGADLVENPHAKDVMSRTFGEVLSATEYRTLRMINQIPLLSQLPFWRKNILDSGIARVTEFVNQIVADRRQGKSNSMGDGRDLLDLLLSATDEQGQSFTDEEVRDESLTFVIAGSETTGNLMVWMLYVLMTNEAVFEACREEVDRVLPNGKELTAEHLPDLAVCEAVINETLRLYPPVPLISRQCIKEHTIGTKQQLRMPKGATMVVDSYILHRRGDLWPRPHEFDYTRWMRDPKTGLKPKLPHPYAYLPFAAGPRNCIGQNFALLEGKIMLAMFIQRCHFELVPGQKIVPEIRITVRSKYGIFANISKRQL